MNMYVSILRTIDLFTRRGRYDEAIKFLLSVLNSSFDKNTVAGQLPDVYKIAIGLNLSFSYIQTEKYKEGEALLTVYENMQGELPEIIGRLSMPTFLINKSALHVYKGDIQKADKLLSKSIEIATKKGFGVPIQILNLIASMSRLAVSQGHYEYAERWLRLAFLSDLSSLRKYDTAYSSKIITNALSDYIIYAKKNNNADTPLSAIFSMIQRVSKLSASDSISTSLARAMRNDTERLIQKKIDNLRIDKRELLKIKYKLLYDDKKSLLKINKKLDKVDERIEEYKSKLKSESKKEEINVSDVQDALHHNDALISMLVSDARTHIWVVTKDKITDVIQPFTRKELDEHVGKLRKALNPNNMDADFPYQSSAILYDNLIRPIKSELKNIDRLIIIPQGSLANIPFSVLLSSRESIQIETLKIKQDDDSFYFRGISGIHDGGTRQHDVAVNAKWLISEYALATLPSISSFLRLVKFNKNNKTPNRFLGVGNPVLSGNSKIVGNNLLTAYSDLRGNFSGNSLALLSPLPETENELKQEAKRFKFSKLLLGDKATEYSLYKLDLKKYDVISFATHALVAGELPSIVDPSIILTPIDSQNPKNDGLLTATEIAYLDLNADMVILSACNTAASDGETTSDGLSGLASAFFYAGAKSLFVSYWSVISSSAVKVTTGMFKHWQGNRSYAHRHQASVMDLLANTQDKTQLHPAYWAPFAVIGIN